MWNGIYAEPDEERREERKHRDPVLPAQPSSSVQRKKRSHATADGLPVHSFETLMKDLGSRARVTYALKPQKPEKNEFNIPTVPELCKMFTVGARRGSGPRGRGTSY